MSTLKVTVEKIESILEHPGADRLELAQILGWQCVVQKGKYKAGDLVIYFPIDSILPEELEATIFGPDSKVKLTKHRVKTIKLRGAISQGMAVPLDVCGLAYCDYGVGDDVTQKLGVTKYEPPAPGFQSVGGVRSSNKNPNPNFHKYTSIENHKNYHKLFGEDDEVVITEKIHGTNFRAGWVPFHADSLWKKFKQLIRLAPKYEFIYGSHNVQLSNKLLYDGWYDKNVYAEAVHKYELKEKLSHGQVVYGEIYGPNIQKGYHYGLTESVRKLVIFDLMQDGQYLDHDAVAIFGILNGLDVVPTVYQGRFGDADLNQLVSGDSVFCPEQKVREGVVVRPVKEEKCHIGRKILKVINPEYLLGDQSEYH